jgi:hypothetical protein
MKTLEPASRRPMIEDVVGGRPRSRDANTRALALALCLAVLCACSPRAASTNGYHEDVVPGISKDRAIELLGKPQDSETFSLPNTIVQADVLSYPFGQVLVQNGKVVAVSLDDDPAFVGAFGVKLGMSADDLRSALAHGAHAGHLESYDAIGKSSDTRTKDLYDDTDHMMIELTAANANDPLAPFNVAQVTLANAAGMQLIDAFTKARLAGLYPDVHVDNFVSTPWEAGHRI